MNDEILGTNDQKTSPIDPMKGPPAQLDEAGLEDLIVRLQHKPQSNIAQYIFDGFAKVRHVSKEQHREWFRRNDSV